MLLGGDELHRLIERNLWLGAAKDGVGLLSVHPDGGDGTGNSHFVQASQDVVQADSFACILLQSDDGKTAVVQYVVDKGQGCAFFLQILKKD